MSCACEEDAKTHNVISQVVLFILNCQICPSFPSSFYSKRFMLVFSVYIYTRTKST